MSEPALSRRHTTSARGLLFTVLGEFVLPTGGSAWTSAFIDVLGRLGVAEKASRQALMRTAGDGWLTPERVGRRTRWHLTPDADRLLTEGARRIYGFTATTPEWDGRWLLLLTRTPETERPTRHLLRTRLTWAGLGSPAPGVWLTTDTTRLKEVQEILTTAGVEDAQLFTAERAGNGQVEALVRQAWNLDSIARRYERFRIDFAAPRADDPLTRILELVHAWRRFPWLDPALPAELLPPDWTGTQAAQLFTRRHAEWTTAAGQEWHRITTIQAGSGSRSAEPKTHGEVRRTSPASARTPAAARRRRPG